MNQNQPPKKQPSSTPAPSPTPSNLNQLQRSKEAQWLLNEKYNGIPSPAYEEDLARLTNDEPLAYIIGSIPFLTTTIHLDSRPLIPRSESEYWLEQALKQAPKEPLRILDIFAGSGALGVAWLTHRPQDSLVFAEIDTAHHATIRHNLKANNLPEQSIVGGDMFEHVSGTFDVMLANPPYVPTTRLLAPSVTAFEPAKALYADEDGLSFIRRLAQEAPAFLHPSGTLYVEHDEHHDATACFPETTWSTQQWNDQYGKPRTIVAHLVHAT